MILTLPNIPTSLLIVLIVFAIATSSVIGTGYGKKMSSSIFSDSETVQTSGDTNQNIIERIASLQKQINELRRQIQTLPAGPPGPPGPPGSPGNLVVTQRSSDDCRLPEGVGAGTIKCTALCNSDEVVTGGGFDLDTSQGASSIMPVPIREFASENGWFVAIEILAQGDWKIKAFAECLKITA